jgi:hypothetical protein
MEAGYSTSAVALRVVEGDLALQKSYCCEIQRSENRTVYFKTHLVESSKEVYGSKRVVLPMMMMIRGTILK